jgi:uncharacterized protein with HEPN domain
MSKSRRIEDYLNDILESIADIKSFTSGMSFEVFETDRKTSQAVLRSLEVIGEAVKKLPSEIKTNYPQIPWKEIAGMRDKLIHEYFGVDLEIVWSSIGDDLQPLEDSIREITKHYSQ